MHPSLGGYILHFGGKGAGSSGYYCCWGKQTECEDEEEKPAEVDRGEWRIHTRLFTSRGGLGSESNIIMNTPSNYTRVPNTRESAVEVVTGQVARALLGGLSQIFQWDEETEELAE